LRALRPLDDAELRSILAYYGMESLPGGLLLISSGKKVRAVTEEAYRLARKMKGVVGLGIYTAKRLGDIFYLSIEGSQLLGRHMGRRVLEITLEEAEEWMRGSPIRREGLEPGGIAVIRSGEIYLGSGRISRDGKIYPLVPRDRQINRAQSAGLGGESPEDQV
jgi:NOL1/NOP2/fmu family ribosome biogenesis protein